MSTCNIVGTIRNSGGIALSGQLWTELDLQIVDESPTPDDIYTTKLHKFAIAAGVVNINLAESETSRVSYRFRFFANNPDNLETGIDEEPTFDFHALVPNQPSVNLSELIPTGITKDTLDTAIARLARILVQTADFREQLRGGPTPKGNYSASTYYREGDFVSYGGSGWLYINAEPAAGQTPSAGNTAYWMLAAAKGDAGGTGGQNTAYDATGWNGALWAPSANAVRNIIEQLARINSPALTGNPTVPLQLLTNESDRIASTLYVANKISDRLNNLTLTTQPNTTNNTTPATTAFVKNVAHRYSRIVDQRASGTNGGSSVTGTQTRTLNTIATNAGDVTNLTGNVFTLRAGTYRIQARGGALNPSQHRLLLWNNTANALAVLGESRFCGSTSSVLDWAVLAETLTVAASTDFSLRHWISTSAATNGLGVALGDGNLELYAVVEIWRVD